MIKIGDRIPKFELKDQDGKLISSDSFIGKKTLLFFYPKANTPGCTAQACSMNENIDKFYKKDVLVFGISNDEVSKQKKYHDKFQFAFPLLCDTDHSVTEQFGIWQLKKMMGKEYMGLVRTSFVFDESGICVEIINKVNTKAHADQFEL